MNIARDKQLETAGKRESPAPRAATFGFGAEPAFIIELDEMAGLELHLRPAIEIAGKRAVNRIGQKIKPMVAMNGAADDDIHQSPQTQPLILFGEAGDFGFDGLVGLRVECAARVPVAERHKRRRRCREQHQINQQESGRPENEEALECGC